MSGQDQRLRLGAGNCDCGAGQIQLDGAAQGPLGRDRERSGSDKTPVQIDCGAAGVVLEIVLPQIAEKSVPEASICDNRLKVQSRKHCFSGAALGGPNENINVVEFPVLGPAIDLLAQRRTLEEQRRDPARSKTLRQINDVCGCLHDAEPVAALEFAELFKQFCGSG